MKYKYKKFHEFFTNCSVKRYHRDKHIHHIHINWKQYKPIHYHIKLYTILQESWPVLEGCDVTMHGDIIIIKWKHFPRYWPFVWGIHRSSVNSRHKDQWRRVLMFSLMCASTNGSVNNRGAGDLRCHRANYDVTIMARGHVQTAAADNGLSINCHSAFTHCGLLT